MRAATHYNQWNDRAIMGSSKMDNDIELPCTVHSKYDVTGPL